MRTRNASRRSSLSGVIPLLILALALTAFLAVQAVLARQRHREAARSVVRDYATILAQDYLRQLAFELEAFTFTPLRIAISEYAAAHSSIPSKEWLRQNGSPVSRNAAGAIDELFFVNFDKGIVYGTVSEELRTWIVAEMHPAVLTKPEWSGRSLRASLPSGDRAIVYGTKDGTPLALGFTVDEDALRRSALNAFNRISTQKGLLRERTGPADAFLSISGAHKKLIETGGSYDPEYGVEFTTDESYGGALAGLVVRSSISPRAASRVISGGVPASRLVQLLLMLAVTSAILIAATIVLSRERQLEKLRGDFISGVSHELRTPLTQIRMFSETLLLNRVRSDDERQRSVRIIHQEASRLSYLVENLLFFTRGQKSAMPIHRITTDVSQLIEETVAAFVPLAHSRGSTISYKSEGTLVIPVDADALKQATINLLDNALKYGPRGQTVAVAAERAGPVIQITVEDEGPGVPEKDREKIWERFHRLTRDRGNHEGGSGIGLAVVRDVVTRHGGMCRVENREGRGARFVIELPAAAEA